MEESAKQALVRYQNVIASKPDILWVPDLVTKMASKLKAGKVGKNYFTSNRGFSFFQKKLDQLDNIIRLFQDMESNRERLPDKPGGKAKSIKSASARLYEYLGKVKTCDTSADSSKNLVKNYLDRVEKKLKTVQGCFLTYFKNSTKPKKQPKPAMWSPSPEKGSSVSDNEINSLFEAASEEVFSDGEEEEPKVPAEEEEEEDSSSVTDMSVEDGDMVDEVESSDSESASPPAQPDIMVSMDGVEQHSGLTYALYVLKDTGPKKITIGYFKSGREAMEWGRKMYPGKICWPELQSFVFKNSNI